MLLSGASGLPSIVFHTSKEFGKKYIDENAETVQDIITQRIKTLFPDIPIPAETKFHKWRYSQVEKKVITESLGAWYFQRGLFSFVEETVLPILILKAVFFQLKT
ncbi:renalase [Caerostris extrusa]|uniref:Renalase n=1 Tax=Caerostris extrusa TaxID=172846 RepID=A0AAV4W6I9_CAEEX|nr:renalase [Caerostris extrusa]